MKISLKIMTKNLKSMLSQYMFTIFASWFVYYVDMYNGTAQQKVDIACN